MHVCNELQYLQQIVAEILCISVTAMKWAMHWIVGVSGCFAVDWQVHSACFWVFCSALVLWATHSGRFYSRRARCAVHSGCFAVVLTGCHSQFTSCASLPEVSLPHSTHICSNQPCLTYVNYVRFIHFNVHNNTHRYTEIKHITKDKFLLSKNILGSYVVCICKSKRLNTE